MGHIPAFKNKKRTILLNNGGTMPVTDPKTKDWMNRCIQSIASQLYSSSAIIDHATSTGVSLRSSIASCVPLDDSRQWIPEEHTYSQDVDAGNEGVFIVIERIEDAHSIHAPVDGKTNDDKPIHAKVGIRGGDQEKKK